MCTLQVFGGNKVEIRCALTITKCECISLVLIQWTNEFTLHFHWVSFNGISELTQNPMRALDECLFSGPINSPCIFTRSRTVGATATSLKIQWKHLSYNDTFSCSDVHVFQRICSKEQIAESETLCTHMNYKLVQHYPNVHHHQFSTFYSHSDT
jgi:hypothetical protein